MASSSSAAKAPDTPRNSNAAYRDDPLDDAETPLIGPSEGETDPRPFLDFHFSVAGFIRLVTIPLSMACAGMLMSTPRAPLVSTIFILLFFAVSLWNWSWTVFYFRRRRTALDGKVKPSQIEILGYDITVVRKRRFDKSKQLKIVVAFIDILYITLMIVAVVVPCTIHMFYEVVVPYAIVGSLLLYAVAPD
jgi:hypothetical protein